MEPLWSAVPSSLRDEFDAAKAIASVKERASGLGLDAEASNGPTVADAEVKQLNAEIKQIEEDRARAEEAAKLREEDYQLAYAVDILRGLSVMGGSQPE